MWGYVELHAHSCFSLLDGASTPKALVKQAAKLGMDALALTDHDAVYGAVRFSAAAKAAGVRPIFGAEMTLEDGHHLTLLVRDSQGWRNLCSLITQARHNAPKGGASLKPEWLHGQTAGLVGLSGCRRGEVTARVLQGDVEGAKATLKRYRDLFDPDSFFVEVQRHLLPEDNRLTKALVGLAAAEGVAGVATNNVHYAQRAGHRLQDVLVGIRHNCTLDEAAPHRRPNSEYYLKSGRQMARLFARWSRLVQNTRRVADLCDFRLDYGLQDLPAYVTPPGVSTDTYLRQLCKDGLRHRYTEIPSRAVDQLDHELTIIGESGLSNYFLIVWDVVRFARENGILCQGRGSAANSLVAYLLQISPVDPLAHNLVFERFLSRERQVVPDIDIDFDAARREEVIQYVYERYGHEHAAMACTFVAFRARSAVRDVGKVLGLSPEVVRRATKVFDSRRPDVKQLTEGGEALPDDHPVTQLVDLAAQIDGLPRHLGIHNGGMVVMGSPLVHRLPTEPATMKDRFVVQWDKDALEDIGLVKIDILGLRMLSLVAEATAAVGEEPPDMNDPAVYAMISDADTVGVFQVESRAQTQTLPRLQPRNFEDVVIGISLIRPGPLQGDMVHPYLRRRSGEEPVTYPHPSLEDALRETLGVILFQEQVLKVARDFAGFTAGQGEQLRRALGSKDAAARVEALHDDFVKGAVERGADLETAEDVFNRLRAFGGYSFPKSHAAAFAVLVYRSAWLKRYHPAHFYAALLNNQPMGFWSPAVIVNEMRRRGLPVLPVDIHHSEVRCTVVGDGVRLGLNYVKGLGVKAQHIIDNRPFDDLGDFVRRTRLPRRLIERLIRAGALDAFGESRRVLLWSLGLVRDDDTALDLDFDADPVELPPLSELEAMGMEVDVTGLSTGDHLMTAFRDWLRERSVMSSADLDSVPERQRVRAAGLIVMHQAPGTAKGFHFVTLEDEFGFINVVFKPDVYAAHRQVVRGTAVLVVEGVVERRNRVLNLIAERVWALQRQ